MEHGIKAKDGGLRCGEIKVHSLSCTKSMASVGKININKINIIHATSSNCGDIPKKVYNTKLIILID